MRTFTIKLFGPAREALKASTVTVDLECNLAGGTEDPLPATVEALLLKLKQDYPELTTVGRSS